MGHRNIICSNLDLEDGVYGTNGTTRAFCISEGGAVAKMESRPVLSDIGRALGKHAGSVHGVVSSNGGIVPSDRRRSRLALTLAEREEISRGIAAGCPIREIAAGIARSPSTVSREIARHGGHHRYRASEADSEAWEQARRPKPCKLTVHLKLQWIVASKLISDWSPEQIAGWLEREFQDDVLRSKQ